MALILFFAYLCMKKTKNCVDIKAIAFLNILRQRVKNKCGKDDLK